MLLLTSLLAFSASILCNVHANPLEPRTITVPLHKPSLRHSGISGADVVRKDRERIRKYNGGVTARVPAQRASSGIVTNVIVSYLATIKFGQNTFQLVVDTGSALTWAGAQGGYNPGSTGVRSGGTVSVQYGSGSFRGNQYNDTVCFSSLCVSRQSVGIATSSSGFDGVDGILGLGPVGLTRGDVSKMTLVPTFSDNLKSQRKISTEVVGVYFKPESGSHSADANGQLTFGGVDSSKFHGSISYMRKATSGPHAGYWGIDITSVTLGSALLYGKHGAIVDTGTTLIYIPTSAYNSFLKATGGTTDNSLQFARFKKRPTANFVIHVGSSSFTLTPAQYLVPAAQYENWGFSSAYYYAWINDGGSSGVNFILGQKFLEQYYSVFDTTQSRVGFAART